MTDAELIAELERERVLCQSWHDDAVSTQKMLMEANETIARLTAANKALAEAAEIGLNYIHNEFQTSSQECDDGSHIAEVARADWLTITAALSRAVEAAHE